MELDLEGKQAARAYAILASLVTPRPIALVTTLGPGGVINVAPFSFFNVLGAEPPIVAFAPGDREDGTPKDTALNVRAGHEFVVNLVDEAIAEAMNRCAASLPYGTSELNEAGLSTVPSSVIAPPRIAEAPVHLECRFIKSVEVPGWTEADNYRVIFGEVIGIHIDDSVLTDEGLVDIRKMGVISRLGYNDYARVDAESVFSMERPIVERSGAKK